MLQVQASESKIPTKWKKRTAPEHIRPAHVMPAFDHPTVSEPLCWAFPPQETNVVPLHPR